jgi:hypothetical protein
MTPEKQLALQEHIQAFATEYAVMGFSRDTRKMGHVVKYVTEIKPKP